MRTASHLLVLALAACAPHPPPRTPAPAPAPAPVPAGASGNAAPPAAGEDHGLCIPEAGCVLACVLRDGRLESVDLYYNPATGDSTHRGRRFSEAFPNDSTYALNAAWFRNDAPISFAGRRYVKYGLPRILGTTDVVPIGTFDGVAVFMEAGRSRETSEVLYILVQRGCEFQPYMASGIK